MPSSLPVSAIGAGFLAVLVSLAGPLAIFYQAAQAGHMSNEMFASWVWGITLGAALAGIMLSWTLKAPVITAWSAPGTALLIPLFPALSIHEAVGAYLTAAVLLLAIGLSGGFERLMAYVPKGIASGMMAGILLPFGLNAFKGMGTSPLLVCGMLVTFLLFKRLYPRYAVVLLLATGIAIAMMTGQTHLASVQLQLVTPQFIPPEWSWSSTFSLALPLVLTTLSGQYLPGMTILKSAGYNVPVRRVVAVNSVASIITAFTGGITIAIAAITAAMCTGRDAHEDPRKRYIAGIANGVFYLLAGLCGGSVVMLFAALPKELIVTLAGLALLGPITTNLAQIAESPEREASVLTFLATASGMTFLGLGSAFWGILIGMAAHKFNHHYYNKGDQHHAAHRHP
ncbi:benzoate membrane transport protein [Duganella sp. CF402]|uniref:benzoate/H(+) symporter BenE family transporter n=1 Tax=unclassified Duganella TaxID=2636909 RepID=UPI0008B8B9A7|nr:MULTISPECIES: benzoate/H(+) symporter BenE family transporter [unclassified Duganella]RZT10455.1 benzoate membrane transport protein [Duganella sp. BK701]SEL12459.1 benzoate membrane transport protein [Duganella sp. CF402]